MVDETTNVNEDMAQDDEVLDELTLLKQRAKKLNIRIQGNPSAETLKALIAEKTASTVEEGTGTPMRDKHQRYEAIRKEALKLVRVRITCMNPAFRDWEGDIKEVSNKAIGTVKKFIPFHPESHPDGYHIPQALLNVLQAKEFQTFREIKHPNGEKTKKAVMVKEFAIEILPPLTPEELKDLAKAQAAKGGL